MSADPRIAKLLMPRLAAKDGAPVPPPGPIDQPAIPPKRRGGKAHSTPVEWAAVEPDYRAGIMTTRAMGKKHSVSAGAIVKHAKEYGWTRDLTARINAKAEELVNKHLSNVKVNNPTEDDNIVLPVAILQAEVRISERTDIGKARALLQKLMGRLTQQINTACDDEGYALLQRLGEENFSPNKSGRDPLNELYHQIISTPGQIKAMKEAAEALKTLIALEREAWRIDKMADDTGASGRKNLEVRFVQAPQQLEDQRDDG